MGDHDLAGDGKTQPGPSGAAGAGGVEPGEPPDDVIEVDVQLDRQFNVVGDEADDESDGD